MIARVPTIARARAGAYRESLSQNSQATSPPNKTVPRNRTDELSRPLMLAGANFDKKVFRSRRPSLSQELEMAGDWTTPDPSRPKPRSYWRAFTSSSWTPFIPAVAVALVIGIGAFWTLVNTGGPSNQCPLECGGPLLGFGEPAPFSVASNGSGVGGCTVPPVGVTHYCYSVRFAAMSGGATTQGLSFELKDATGIAVTLTSVTLVDKIQRGMVIWQPASGWQSCTVALCSTPLSNDSKMVPAMLNTTQSLIVAIGSDGGTGHGDSFICWSPPPAAGSATVNLP
jgi:hypothetical protein